MRDEKLPTISEIYAKGKRNLEEMGLKGTFPPDSSIGASLRANREYLDSLFFVPKLLAPVTVDTSCAIFGAKLRTSILCSAISRGGPLSGTGIIEIARGVGNAGALMMLGIGGSDEVQSAIDTGVPVVKIVKPYRRTELIYEKIRDAESRGCVAVGMDIDHFHGALGGQQVALTKLFSPQRTEELRQLISQTKVPFIIKGVLSVTDAEKAVQLGASAIVVSNHGASFLDFSIPAAIALPRITDCVGDKLTVLVDTGFKTGNDVLKGLALGAKAVGFASSMIIAWGADGSSGVELLTNQITAELQRSMAATGCPNLPSITRSILTEILPMRVIE